MDIIFRGQHLDIPGQFKTYANDHLAKISRYLPSADHAIVDVRREAGGEEGRYVVATFTTSDALSPRGAGSAGGHRVRAGDLHTL